MMAKAVLLGALTVTSYRATPNQTKPECRDNQNCQTSIGENVSELGFAASQDLLKSGVIKYGDYIWITGIGGRTCNDSMGVRARKAIDIFVYTLDEERKIGIRHVDVYLIKIQGDK